MAALRYRMPHILRSRLTLCQGQPAPRRSRRVALPSYPPQRLLLSPPLRGWGVARQGKTLAMLTLEGTQLGNYDVIRRIRVGGMGAVYEGRQRTAFGRRVAIKAILGSYASDPDMRRRFAREAQTIAELHHPHILPLIEFGDERGILYLVMPFIEGGTLTGYLRHSLPDLNEVAAI